MMREISAGGVVLRQIEGVWHIALIEPQKENSEPANSQRKHNRAVFCLPKGLIDSNEKPDDAAIREVREETGITAEIVRKLIDIKYVYVRSWGDGKRIFKVVSFYLMRYVGGEIDNLIPEMRVEVKRAVWVPLVQAEKQMAYSGERGVVLCARESVEAQGLPQKRDPEVTRERRKKPPGGTKRG